MQLWQQHLSPRPADRRGNWQEPFPAQLLDKVRVPAHSPAKFVLHLLLDHVCRKLGNEKKEVMVGEGETVREVEVGREVEAG